ncbi:MAG: nuclease-related domain-containing protein [Propionicimonas sp.]
MAIELDRLRTADGRWICLTAIPGAGRGVQIDHLVIGPGGVFTINAGRHAGSRTWTGSDIRVGRDEAQRAAQALTMATRICVRVQGLVVPVDAKKDATRQPSNIVKIVNHTALVDYLRSQPPYLDGATRTRIAGFARLSSTWSAQPSTERERTQLSHP